MPPTPNKLNLSFARKSYNVFGSRNAATANDHQREQKTELLEGKKEEISYSQTFILRLPLLQIRFVVTDTA